MADNARPVVPFGLGFSLGTLFGLGGACVVQLLLRGALLGAAVDAAPEEVAPVEAAVIAPAQEPAPVAQPPVEEAPERRSPARGRGFKVWLVADESYTGRRSPRCRPPSRPSIQSASTIRTPPASSWSARVKARQAPLGRTQIR